MKTITKFVYSVLAMLALGGFASSPIAQAVSPAPDGGYANFNTAEGTLALLNLNVATGSGNTAVGGRALQSDMTGSYNTATGYGALFSNTASLNTATGFDALFSNSTGTANTASGARALFHNTIGQYNTASGNGALLSNTGGSRNTANGVNALFSNQAGSSNTAVGTNALFHNNSQDASFNTAVGDSALFNNTTGSYNTAVGWSALFSNTAGAMNTAVGLGALRINDGSENTAIGFAALDNNSSSGGNTAIGAYALSNANMGGNTAIGDSALRSGGGGGNTAIGGLALIGNGGNNNTAVGYFALGSIITTGSNNIGLGVGAGDNIALGDNNIDIGNEGVGGDANIIRIGTQGTQSATYITGIYQQPVTGDNAPVLIDATGKLGTAVGSSRRFKKEIKRMDQTSEAILSLKPVTFHYKSDKTNTPQFGLIAEEVAEVNPDLVVRNDKGEIYTVRYDAVNAMLLNEFLKEHKAFLQEQRKVQELKASAAIQNAAFAKLESAVAEYQRRTDVLTAQQKQQATQLQKVSATRKESKPTREMAFNDE